MNHMTISKMLFCFFALACILSCASLQRSDTPKQEVTENSVQKETTKPSNSANSNTFVKSDGWEIPDVTKCKHVARGKNEKSKLNVNTYRICDMPIETEIGTMRVDMIYEHEMKNRKFCYLVQIGYPKPKGNNTQMPGVLTLESYCDLDGDGKFETKKKTSSFQISIPPWIEELD